METLKINVPDFIRENGSNEDIIKNGEEKLAKLQEISEKINKKKSREQEKQKKREKLGAGMLISLCISLVAWSFIAISFLDGANLALYLLPIIPISAIIYIPFSIKLNALEREMDKECVSNMDKSDCYEIINEAYSAVKRYNRDYVRNNGYDKNAVKLGGYVFTVCNDELIYYLNLEDPNAVRESLTKDVQSERAYNLTRKVRFYFKSYDTIESDYISSGEILPQIKEILLTNGKSCFFWEIKLPIENILYFAREGEIKDIQSISGGGSSLTGALIGAVVAGDTGAIIGSRQKITTSTETVDTRKTILYKKNGDKIESMEFSHETYNVFLELIPEKEYHTVISKEAVQTAQNIKTEQMTQNIKPEETNSLSIEDKIRTISDLKSKGLITDDEYNEKKKQILDSL